MTQSYWWIVKAVPALAVGGVVGFVFSPLASSWTIAAPRCSDSSSRASASFTGSSPCPASPATTAAPEQYIHFVMDNVYLKTKDDSVGFKIKKVEFEYKGLEIRADSVIKASLETKGSNEDVAKCAEALSRIAEALSSAKGDKAKAEGDKAKDPVISLPNGQAINVKPKSAPESHCESPDLPERAKADKPKAGSDCDNAKAEEAEAKSDTKPSKKRVKAGNAGDKKEAEPEKTQGYNDLD
jgi:hypothetical protein